MVRLNRLPNKSNLFVVVTAIPGRPRRTPPVRINEAGLGLAVREFLHGLGSKPAARASRRLCGCSDNKLPLVEGRGHRSEWLQRSCRFYRSHEINLWTALQGCRSDNIWYDMGPRCHLLLQRHRQRVFTAAWCFKARSINSAANWHCRIRAGCQSAHRAQHHHVAGPILDAAQCAAAADPSSTDSWMEGALRLLTQLLVHCHRTSHHLACLLPFWNVP